ncbi:MAG: spore germination protein [Oscillospiraceae bacterium]|nr:spore germination protein [Oscillospiraceae bacterium]
MKETLSESLVYNKAILKNMFGDSVDFYTKDISLFGFAGCICMFENLSSIERLWIMMLDSLSKPEITPKTSKDAFDFIFHNTAIPMERSLVHTKDELRAQLTAGTSVILLDGVNTGLVISTQSMQFRSVQEPSGEGNIRGSREGFCELIRVNISLIRRLIRNTELRTETLTVGERTKTDIALCYDASLVQQDLLIEVRKRLQKAKLPFVFDTGYLAPFLHQRGFSFFSAVGYTERPDTAAAKICEGKIVVIANGTPFAMIVPYFFSENFQSMDDYSAKAYFASFIRVLKYCAFFLAILLPGVFVSVANFTPELFPGQLLYKIAASEGATPMPLFMEALFITLLLEIIREAGLRLPKAIGHSVSLVAALIVGDAAVSAGIIGTPIVIVAAMTAICTFVVPALYEPVTVLRLLFILAGGILGPLGIILLFAVMLFNICGMDSFGVPYTSPITPSGKGFWQDGILRASWRTLSKNQFSVKKLPGVQNKNDLQ